MASISVGCKGQWLECPRSLCAHKSVSDLYNYDALALSSSDLSEVNKSIHLKTLSAKFFKDLVSSSSMKKGMQFRHAKPIHSYSTLQAH